MTQLTPFEEHDVVGATISITNAGDGLSDAMKIEPREFEHGETVHVVLETTVSKVRFDPSKDDPEDLIRVHVLKAGLATIVEGSAVSGALTAQRKKLEEAEGVHQLPGIGEDQPGEGEDTSDPAA